MFSAQLYHLPDGKTEALKGEVSVGGELGLERRSLRSTEASPWAHHMPGIPPLEPRPPRGKRQIAKLHSQHWAFASQTPGVPLAKLTNGGLFPVCRQCSFSGEHFHSLQLFSPELLCKPLAPAAAGLGRKWPLT